MPAPSKTFTTVRDEEHVISEAQGRRSREQIELDAISDTHLAGTVLGRIIYGAVTVTPAPKAGNTGNGTFAATPTADAGAPAGRFTITVIEPGANAGAFRVERPDGTEDGTGTIGVAYNGSINFTLNDGATDFVAGDGFNVTVAYAKGNGRYKRLNPAATDGTQIAAAILAPTEKPTDPVSHIRTSAHVRDSEHNGNKLAWPVGLTDDQQAAAEAQLADNGVIVRY